MSCVTLQLKYYGMNNLDESIENNNLNNNEKKINKNKNKR